MRLHIFALCAGVTFGISPSEAQAPPADPAHAQAYEEAFRTTFRSTSIQQCVTKTSQAAGYDFTPTCTCAADTLLRDKTVEELARLSQAPDYQGQINTVVAACLKTDPPLRRR